MGRCYIWTPPSLSDPAGFPGTFEAASNCNTFMFCGGHSSLADGSILAVGGMIGSPDLGSNHSDIFRPTEQQHWTAGANMLQGRWYPTATTLADGRVLACSGNDNAGNYVGTPEIYNPYTDHWYSLDSAFTFYQSELYPYMFLLPDGNMVDAGPGIAYILLTSTWTWNFANPLPSPSSPPNQPPQPGYAASAVMYEPGKIMKCGGLHPIIGDAEVIATTWVVDLDFTDPSFPGGGDANNPPPWMLAGDMNLARRNHNLVILPDGKVLALGGRNPAVNPQPVNKPEIFDPASGTWTLEANAADIARMYHSTAMLLPDGRVFRPAAMTRPRKSSGRLTSPAARRGRRSSPRPHSCNTASSTRSRITSGRAQLMSPGCA